LPVLPVERSKALIPALKGEDQLMKESREKELAE
jgi:hypothetical protein